MTLSVLVVHPSPDLYGADRMLVRSLQALRGAGHTVRIALAEGEGPLLPTLRDAGFEPEVVPVPVLRKSLLRPRALVGLVGGARPDVDRARAVLRRERPDVVYINTLTLPHWLAAAHRERVPSVCHVRELESATRRPLAWALTAPLRLATRVVANSKATRDFLVDAHPGLAGRVQVVYNGLEFPDSLPVPASGSTSTRSRVTVVGRISPRKGQDAALEAVSLLVREGHDVELELVGSVFRGYEWFERSLRERAEQLGISDRLLTPGFASDVWPAYRRADVVAVPSRLEPFGNVAVEAMAAGRPVVASNVGGLPEVVEDGVTGFVVPPADPVALATALARVLSADPEDRAAMGRRGAARARGLFGLDRYAGELEETVAATAASAPFARGV